jgi:pimeloyl-ACP methyl ester carboxylesterase
MARIYKSEDGERAVQERYRTFLRYWPAVNQQFHAPTREGETFVVACGDESAPPLLLLHGSGGNAAMWMGDVAAWAQRYRVYAVDMIGEPGLSAPSRPPLDSEAYALWLDDVLLALSLEQVSMVGISLGGWLAADYATRRPERVRSLILLCPAGIGRQTFGEIAIERAPSDLPPAFRKFMEFVTLISENFQYRMDVLPVFTDDALQRLTMPVMAILGGKDELLDSAETRQRLERNVPDAEIRYLPEAGHLLRGQTVPILEFLLSCQQREGRIRSAERVEAQP